MSKAVCSFGGKQKTSLKRYFYVGASGRIRTYDRLVKSELLYQLSYEGVFYFFKLLNFIFSTSLSIHQDSYEGNIYFTFLQTIYFFSYRATKTAMKAYFENFGILPKITRKAIVFLFCARGGNRILQIRYTLVVSQTKHHRGLRFPPELNRLSSSRTQKRLWLILVPGAGIEPACLAAGDFKSPVYTISPPGQVLIFREA